MTAGRVAVCALLLAACTTGSPSGTATPATPPTSATPAAPVVPSSLSPSPRTDPAAEARTRLTDVEVAAASAPDELRVAVATLLGDELDGLVVDAWEDRVLEGLPTWPVVAGEATMGLDGEVELDVVVDTPPDADGDLVLRWLPGAPALGDAVRELAVRVDGAPVEPVVDGPGARLVVPVEDGTRHVVRVTAAYRVPDRDAIVDDGTPAGYGLLARTDDAVMLGHWLPLVALASDDGPMQARGDVGAFPPAAFSLVVHHDGGLVTGGEDRACPDPRPGCTWVQAVGLRDVAAVLLGDGATTGATARGVAVHVPAGDLPGASPDVVADEAAQLVDALAAPLGELPWPTVDVVAAPIGPGAAGMEFPGIVWLDLGAWPDGGPGFGAYVLAHEVGHQWFHALVGNGSLSAPVVDESLAQYLSVVAFDAVHGPGAGDALATRSIAGRHAAALAEGVPDEPPAQPLDAFATARSYGANVYGRGGQAWLDAEDVAGRGAVLEALRVLVARFGLREVDEQVVVDVLREVAPKAVPPLVDGWGTPTDP